MNEKKNKMKKNEKRNLQRNRAKKIINLSSWPIFNLKPKYISQDKITMAYCWDEMAIIVTEDKNVYSFGFVCSKTNKTLFAPYSRMVENLCGKNIKTFANSSYFVLALTKEGEVYMWKNEEYFPGKPIEINFNRIIALSEKGIVDVACGSNHFLALTSNGKVYAWGSKQINDRYTFLRDDREWQVNSTLENKNVVHIACGKMFNIALTDEGKLYGWRNKKSQIVASYNSADILTTEFNVRTFIKIGYKYDFPREFTTISDKIVKVACGDEHTLALTDKGKVYAWGNNDRGQIGVESNYKLDKFSSPTMVKMPEVVLNIAACHQSSVAVDINEVIYVWGNFFSKCITTPLPTKLLRIHDAFAQTGFNSAMHKPLIAYTDYISMLKKLRSQIFGIESLEVEFDDPSTSDFTVQVEGQLIYVHKNILEKRCKYFRNLFQRDLIENNQNIGSSAVYTVPDKYSYIVYRAFLKYIYTRNLDHAPSENALELIKLADEFDETSLTRNCIQILDKQAITSSNVALLYSKAIECHTEELEDFCFEFILRHLKAVVLSNEYSKLDMHIKNKLIRRIAREDVFETSHKIEYDYSLEIWIWFARLGF